MKNVLLLLSFLFVLTTFAQYTTIPDSHFEAYLETHNANGVVVPFGDPTSMGDGIYNNSLVLSNRINTVIALNVSSQGIVDMKGLEGFTLLENLNCSFNSIAILDITPVSNLKRLRCSDNLITTLDLSENLQLIRLNCSNNQLDTLNVKNGNNTNVQDFDATDNIDLACITVDNPIYSTTNWTNIDAQTSFNHNCASPETYVPDSNFENYLETHNASGTVVPLGNVTSMGNGINDHYVTTANINSVFNLFISNKNISDLTGIEDFTSLENFDCSYNTIANVDFSQNLQVLQIDISSNLLTSLDLSTNLDLEELLCFGNSISTLDLSSNSNFVLLECYSNNLTLLNVQNGNNTNFTGFDATLNPLLTCITVDNPTYSTTNWTIIDAQTNFNHNCASPETHVPDPNFENYLETHNSSGTVVPLGDVTSMGNGIANDEYVTTTNINTVTNLVVNNLNIADMTGIEDFMMLTALNCHSNQLTSLNITQNTLLQGLYCADNQLINLDVTTNTALVDLYCDVNQLTSLNVSANTALTNFSCGNNQLTSLNVSTNTSLTNFSCSRNQLTSLNVSTNTALIYFSCDNNLLTNLDISHNSLLEGLNCHFNSLTYLNVNNNTLLTHLHCFNNSLTSLDISYNVALTTLWIYHNSITSLDTTTNVTLANLRCLSNQLTSLDLSTNNALQLLDCQSNLLTSLNLKNGNNTIISNAHLITTNNPNLTCIEVDDVAYSTTNWSNVDATSTFSTHCPLGETHVPDPNFENYLETHNSSGTVVPLGDVTSMGNGIANDHYVTTANINTVTNLDVNNLNITDMTGIEDFTAITHLTCNDNQITSIDLTQNTQLVFLNIMVNQLTSIDLTQNVNLDLLIIHDNQISPTIDLSANVLLTGLGIFNNGLTSIDLSANPLLTSLGVANNNLTALDLTNNTNIQYFQCENNQIASLDVSMIPTLLTLYCFNNQLTSLNVKSGNNTNIISHQFKSYNNPNLTCIEVDNPNYSNTHWTNIDAASTFSNDCPNLCSYPSNQTASIITAIGATLDWQENGTATTWDLEIGIQGFTPTGNPTDNDINKPYIWSNGQANTSYDYYVRADCNSDNVNTSAWVGPFSFTTLNKVVCFTSTGFTLDTNTSFDDVSNSSIAFADVDGDSDQDVLITGNNPSHQNIAKLYTNNGMGVFTEVIGTPFDGVAGSSIAFTDVDGDSDQDVLITGFSLINHLRIAKLYTNNGTGVFTEVTGTPFEGVQMSSIAFVDVDSDSDQDVLITGQNSSFQKIAKLYTNNGMGIFTEVIGTPFDGVWSSSIAFTDVDGDSDQDVLITGQNNSGQPIAKLYTNNGTGVFTEVIGTPFDGVYLSSIAFADVDGDSDQDVLITGNNPSYQPIAKLYTNNGTGVFTEVTGTPFVGADRSSIVFADVDNDSDQDVLITGLDINGYQIAKLYTNSGTGVFTEVIGTPFDVVYLSSIAFADVDGDSDQDLLITGHNLSAQAKTKLYTNNFLNIFETKYTNTGWSNGTPTLNKCAVIDQDFTTTSFSSYKTTVNATKTLTIAANTYMQVQKNIENNGTITIEPTGAVVQIEDSSTVTGAGTFNTKIETTPLQDNTRYTYFSSPSATETLNAFAPWADLNYMWDYNEIVQSWHYITNPATPMEAAKGYIIRGDISNTYPNYVGMTIFQNAYNNGVITQDLNFKGDGLTANVDNDGNLVGNPYPSAISGFKLLNPTLNPTAGTLYFWTHNLPMVGGIFSTNDYAMWNITGGTVAISGGTSPTGYIASGQGFFIDAEGDETLPLGQDVTSTLTFNNDMRETLNNTDFRTLETTEYDKIWLNLTNAQGVFNQALIAFLPNATTAYEHTYDGKRIPNGVASFYSVGLENQHFGIQALPLLQEDTIIPLGYQIENEDITNLQISIDHLEKMENVEVYLKDNLLHSVHNLSQGAYSFSVTESGIFDTRFELLFRSSALSQEDILISEDLIVSNINDDKIVVKTTHGSIIKQIYVYDSLGKLIIYSKHNNAVVNLQASTINQGTVLFIKVTLENGVVMHKKLIKL